MEWLGGTVNKEDVGEEGIGKTPPSKRKRDEEGEDDALGAFALRFKYIPRAVVPPFNAHPEI
jgi:cleavage and polyadenylation specificity factor subunit 2